MTEADMVAVIMVVLIVVTATVVWYIDKKGSKYADR